VYDAVVIGAGPNGLAAAITLARARRSVLVVEAAAVAGGGLRTEALTLDGFLHDVCSSVYPLGAASPFFRSLQLETLGLEWIHPPIPAAHPLDDGRVVILARSIEETVAGLGEDGPAYTRLMRPFVERLPALLDEILAPVHVPRHPLLLARFGRRAIRPATSLARALFRTSAARALFAGIAAHSVLPLESIAASAAALVLGPPAHASGWPIVRGGAGRLADVLVRCLRQSGGELETGRRVASLDELPRARAVLCDVTPRQFVALAGDRLSARDRSAYAAYRYGPGAFKVDWALEGPIPWRAEACSRAGTVHVGGTIEEIAASERAAWRRGPAAPPFVIVTQPSLFDPTRAPAGRHVAWAYCHVPHASTDDMTDAIESQVERYAPGFRRLILARHVMAPADLERRNPNLVGGDIGGGAFTLRQLVFRPTRRLYRTPIPDVCLCSASTPPGGGVHGMCGYHAAQVVLGA
jgi:phytoene dehydrogenase-like protein